MRRTLLALELLALLALVTATRCANWRDVFVDRAVYFADGDCYARMTRARLVFEHRGGVIRHHDFENYPSGTTPHTTAPFDYLIVAGGCLLRPFTRAPLDVAGAFISPMLGLCAAAFLWWWALRLRIAFRSPMLILFAVSPILVHATELGRPDHQSLLLLLLTLAICSDEALRRDASQGWSIASGVAWGVAIWVSAFEPIALLIISTVIDVVRRERFLQGKGRWLAFVAVILVAAAIEQRVPTMANLGSTEFAQWSAQIGELASVRIADLIWLRWFGLLIVAAPVLLFLRVRRFAGAPVSLILLAVATFSLTIWQARWACFFGLVFVLLLPSILGVLGRRWVVGIVFALSLYPIASAWDAALWPDESELQRRVEHRVEDINLRAMSNDLRDRSDGAFIAPWWLSPEIAYWSTHPGVSGSSHEALQGNITAAEFYTAENPEAAASASAKTGARYVISYDAERVATNAAGLLGHAVPGNAICYILDRQPSRAPAFIRPISQNATARLFTINGTD